MRWANFHRSSNLVSLLTSLPRTRLHPAVVAFADDSNRRGKWLIAFSGGADSLTLLLLLWAYWPDRRHQLCAVHFNHRLRGRAAKVDEDFCRRVCLGLAVKFRVGQWKAAPKKVSEALARSARFEFFARELRAQDARVLWFGHQQDDIAETMLMRLARGSGAAGLAAPRPIQIIDKRRWHLRPLLTLKKDEIVAALSAADIPWREDASNIGSEFLRNRVRQSVIPSWQQSAGDRDVRLGVSISRELIEEDNSALESWVDRLMPKKLRSRLPLANFRGEPTAILRRGLRRWLTAQTEAGELSRAGFVTLLRAVESGRPTRQSLGKKGFAVLTKDHLSFTKARSEFNFRK